MANDSGSWVGDSRAREGAPSAVHDVTVEVYAVLGTATLPIAQLLKLGRGAVVELDRHVTDPIDLFVNRKKIAHGDVVVVEDHIAVSITDVLGRPKD